jgi:hypothetical protein
LREEELNLNLFSEIINNRVIKMKPEFSICGDSKISGGSIPLSFPPAEYSTSSVSVVYNLENRLPTLSGFDGHPPGLYLLGERPSPEKVMQSLEEKIPELSFEGLLENTHFKLCEDGKVRYKGGKNPKEFGEAIAEIYGRIATEWATEISKYDPKVEKIDGEMEERIIERIKNEFHKRFDPTGIPREWLEKYVDPDYFETQNTSVPETNPNIYPQPPKAPSIGDAAVPTTNLPVSQQGSVYSSPTISQRNVITEGKTKNKEGLLKRFVKWIGEHKKPVVVGGVTAAFIIGAAYAGICGFGGDHSVLPGEKVENVMLYKNYQPSFNEKVQFFAINPDSQEVDSCYLVFWKMGEKYGIVYKQPIQYQYPVEDYMYKVIGKDTKAISQFEDHDAQTIKEKGTPVLFAKSIEVVCLKGSSVAMKDGNKSLTFSFVPDNYVDQNLPLKEVKIEATDAAPVSLEREKNNKTVRQLAEASA